MINIIENTFKFTSSVKKVLNIIYKCPPSDFSAAARTPQKYQSPGKYSPALSTSSLQYPGTNMII